MSFEKEIIDKSVGIEIGAKKKTKKLKNYTNHHRSHGRDYLKKADKIINIKSYLNKIENPDVIPFLPNINNNSMNTFRGNTRLTTPLSSTHSPRLYIASPKYKERKYNKLPPIKTKGCSNT